MSDLATRIEKYNQAVREAASLIPEITSRHPALCPQLIPQENVRGNDYNPNRVAPPEMRLLAHSIRRDGITMAIVVAPDPEDSGRRVVVDGFHRTTVAKTEADVKASLQGYLPVVELDKNYEDLMASTVRHNMARGAHQVELTSKLVTTLTKHTWSDEKIGQELGMDKDEVLRMKQVTGLAEAFADKELSEAWEWVD